ncbi:MAG: hypothetical protein EB116_20170 [Betaproteobacteria bacterium]|nr:hypothetical protein [Betaproteobacteria bacterium]
MISAGFQLFIGIGVEGYQSLGRIPPSSSKFIISGKQPDGCAFGHKCTLISTMPPQTHDGFPLSFVQDG